MGILTADKPKCLTMLAGRPLLDWQLSSLDEAGISDITVIRGYQKELLSDSRFSVLDNDAWADTNMVATLSCAASLLSESICLVSYSDIVYHPDHVRALATCNGDIAITYDVSWVSLWKTRFANVLADAETFQQRNGLLQAVGERASRIEEIEGQYMGLLKISPAGWSKIEELLSTLPLERRNRIDMTSLLMALISKGVSVHCVPVDGRWCEVDSEADAFAYERLLEDAPRENRRWRHDWRW